MSGAGRCDSADRHIPARRPRRMRPPSVLIPPGTTISQAVKRMADDATSSAVVVDGSGRPRASSPSRTWCAGYHAALATGPNRRRARPARAGRCERRVSRPDSRAAARRCRTRRGALERGRDQAAVGARARAAARRAGTGRPARLAHAATCCSRLKDAGAPKERPRCFARAAAPSILFMIERCRDAITAIAAARHSGRSCHPDPARALAEQRGPVRGELHRGEEIVDAVVRQRLVDRARDSRAPRRAGRRAPSSRRRSPGCAHARSGARRP